MIYTFNFLVCSVFCFFTGHNMQAFPMLFISQFLFSCSDCSLSRKWLIVFACFGYIFNNGVFIINVIWFHELKAEYLLFECLQVLFKSLCQLEQNRIEYIYFLHHNTVHKHGIVMQTTISRPVSYNIIYPSRGLQKSQVRFVACQAVLFQTILKDVYAILISG